MSKLYIFGIGGTGSRVLKSLTMMLATGIDLGDTSEIVPIIIDPDNANANLTHSIEAMNKYSSVHDKLEFHEGSNNQFFKLPIKKIMRNYTLKISDTNNKTFKEFIEFDTMSRTNQAMMKMLFSDKNLESNMQVGFKGNPNIGSVVLNQLASAKEFREFANSFAQDDKIFIISSIFGGTGASGFPLLLKTLRCDHDMPNFANINQANIGALTVLPYFQVEVSQQSEIESSTFIGKTKSALSYYENNIGSDVNSLYFICDDITNIYKNNEGGTEQNNSAHIIEFLGATAISHFANSARPETTQYFELGIKDTPNTESITFSSFYSGLKKTLFTPMTQFSLLAKCLTYNESFYVSRKFATNRDKKMKELYNGDFYKELKEFLELYIEWLDEMKKNHRSLNLFNIQCDKKPFEVVTGLKARKFHWWQKKNYNAITTELNKSFNKCKPCEVEDMFIEMFYVATNKLVKDRLVY